MRSLPFAPMAIAARMMRKDQAVFKARLKQVVAALEHGEPHRPGQD